MPFVPFQKAMKDPRVRKRISEAKFKKAVGKEIVTDKSWARKAPGQGASGSIQVDITAGIAAKFL